MRAHENIVTLRDAFIERNKSDLYLVMDLMDSDLLRIIQSSQPLSNAHNRHFTRQLLQGLAFLHSQGVIHRDIKPSNLFVTRTCQLRIGDFGLARFRPTSEKDENPLTTHVVTRYYRAPELMLSPDGYYDSSVDMWAAGCCIGELLRRKPLFPGRNFVQQLVLIVDALGKPSESELQRIKAYEVRRFLSSRPGDRHGKGIKSLIPESAATPESLSLLHSLLAFNPECRLTAEEALEHAFLSGSSPTSPSTTSTIDMSPSPLDLRPQDLHYEHPRLTLRDLRTHLMKEVVASRKIKEDLLGVQPRKGCLVKSPPGGRGPQEGDDKEVSTQRPVVPSWPTMTATASGSSAGDPVWSEEGGEKPSEAHDGEEGAEGTVKKEGWLKWWRHYYQHEDSKPQHKEAEEEDPWDPAHPMSSFLMALGGKGGASVGIGMMAVQQASMH